MFYPLHSISNQELFEKHLYNPRLPKERNGAACPSYINYRLKVLIELKHPLCFIVGYIQPVTQQCKSKTVQKAPVQSKQPLLKIQTISV